MTPPKDIQDRAYNYAKIKKLEVGVDMWVLTDSYTQAATEERALQWEFLKWADKEGWDYSDGIWYGYGATHTTEQLFDLFLNQNNQPK